MLRRLAEAPLLGWQVQLVTPYPRLLYSGMLPGWVAGHYALEECAIALEPLAARAGAGLTLTAGTGLDLAARELLCADGHRLRWDLLSIDTGPQPALDVLPGAAEHSIPVRPIEDFAVAWPTLLARWAPSGRFRVIVLGAGAAGVELALALRRRAMAQRWPAPHIALVGDTPVPMQGAPAGLRRRIARTLAGHGVEWHGGRKHCVSRQAPWCSRTPRPCPSMPACS